MGVIPHKRRIPVAPIATGFKLFSLRNVWCLVDAKSIAASSGYSVASLVHTSSSVSSPVHIRERGMFEDISTAKLPQLLKHTSSRASFCHFSANSRGFFIDSLAVFTWSGLGFLFVIGLQEKSERERERELSLIHI